MFVADTQNEEEKRREKYGMQYGCAMAKSIDSIGLLQG